MSEKNGWVGARACEVRERQIKLRARRRNSVNRPNAIAMNVEKEVTEAWVS